jgi:hypothetical protein
MVKVRPEAQRKTNYVNAATLVPGKYTAGVQSATWQGAALEGQALYVQKLSQPDVLERRAKNIAKVSDGEWRDAAVKKGGPIIGARMTLGADKQIANSRPYIAALEALTLPPRVADGMANLMARGGAVVQAMEATKKSVG